MTPSKPDNAPSLLGERERIEERVEEINEALVSELEKYILSAIHLGSKVIKSDDVSEPAIIRSVQELYDKRITEVDVRKTLDVLVDKKILRLSKPGRDCEYRIQKGSMSEIPLLTYISEEELSREDNLPF